MWDLSCPNWEQRLRAGRSLIPDLPLNEHQAARGLIAFDECRLPDGFVSADGPPRLGDAAGQWFRDIVRAAFGSWDPVARERFIRDIFCLAPKGSSKTTYAAALLLAVMWLNKRRNCQAIFVGPTQSVSDRAFEQAAAMIELSPDFRRRFHPVHHEKTIIDLDYNVEGKVKTFDLNILTGAILIFAMIDELHLLGRSVHTTKVLRQIRGGLDKTPEGLLVITTTQSDEIPTGAFLDELIYARKIRDGEFRGREIRPMLPILYEFPPDIARDPAKWQDPENWPMVMPNLGRSTHLRDLIPDWNSEKEKGNHPARIWASQHLNIEIGVGMRTDRWPGAQYWERRADPSLTLDEVIRRCEVIVTAGDGGGLDDLLGLVVLGRDRETQDWLCWSYGWCFRNVLEDRKSIASYLLDFEKRGELTICDVDPWVEELSEAIRGGDVQAQATIRAQFKTRGFPRHITEFVAIVKQIKDLGLLYCVGLDPEGLGLTVEALKQIGVTEENKLLAGIGQGYRLMNALKTTELKLQHGMLWHSGSSAMGWCVDNLKIEPTATAIRATKQNAGDLKIDIAMPLFFAADVMSLNPTVEGSIYDDPAYWPAKEETIGVWLA